MKNAREKNKWITLIALVITIVILLILAGVAIGTLGGENGLIAKTQKVKKANIEVEMKKQLTLALQELQIAKEGKATLDDVTQEWADDTLNDYEPTIISDASISGKKATMFKSGTISKFIIDEKLNIIEIEQSDSSIEFSYDVLERIDNKVSILIHVRDRENGLKTIKFPDEEDSMVILDNKKEEKGIDYKVEIGTEYKIKITSESGEVREETILIADYWHTITKNLDGGVSIDNPAVKVAYNKPYTATLTAGDNYIIKTATVEMDGTDITSTVYDATTGTINIEKVTGNIEIIAKAIKLEIETTTPIVNTDSNAITSLPENSVEKGTTLYINFIPTLKGIGGGTFTIKYNESEVTMPYEVTSNGKYTFVVTGTYQGKTTETKTVEVTVNQYKVIGAFVQYDAGDWTEEEIAELQSLALYNINISKTDSTDDVLFTFGGFTYKGDKTNASYINNGTIVTSRNQSVAPQGVGEKPKYDGWQILESKEENGKTYVTSIVHAGSPENFVYYYTGSKDAYRAEYILSSGLRYQSYNTYQARSWQMYVDENQKDLIANTTDKDGNTVKDVHAMTYNEAIAIINSSTAIPEIIITGAKYWLATHSATNSLKMIFENGAYHLSFDSGCFGIRPVVSLKSGVYIASGTGTEEKPYVLAMETTE